MPVDLITGGFTGRMGNQMFQIASVIALALKHNVPYTFQKDRPEAPWKVYFNNFEEHEVENRLYHNEKIGEYEEIQYSGGNLNLCGFYQSEKYFIDYREDIIKAFGLKWSPIKNKVSIHVRRQDYKVGSPFEPITIEYINKAISCFVDKGYFNYVVFSDDIEWCKENIKYDNCNFEFYHGSEFEDMEYMSSCEHNIIANSTFSWWAAWLNQNPNKIVISPVKWFNGVNKDLIPDSWLKF